MLSLTKPCWNEEPHRDYQQLGVKLPRVATTTPGHTLLLGLPNSRRSRIYVSLSMSGEVSGGRGEPSEENSLLRACAATPGLKKGANRELGKTVCV